MLQMCRVMRDLSTFISTSGAEGQEEGAEGAQGTTLSLLITQHLGVSLRHPRAALSAEGRGCWGLAGCPQEAHHAFSLEHGMTNIFYPPDPYGFAGMSSLGSLRANKLW